MTALVQEQTLVASATGRVFSAWPEGLQMADFVAKVGCDR
jgi:hypothetical protein